MISKKSKKAKNKFLKNDKALILVEALLVIVILSFGLTAIIQAMMSSHRAGFNSSSYIRQSGIVNRVMTEKIISDSKLLSSLTQPECQEFQYELELNETDQEIFEGFRFEILKSIVLCSKDKGQRKLTADMLVLKKDNEGSFDASD